MAKHRVFLMRQMASQQLDTYVQTVVAHEALDNGDLIILGKPADMEAYASKQVENIDKDVVFVVDTANVYEDEEGNRLDGKTRDPRNVHTAKGKTVRARMLSVNDLADWDAECFATSVEKDKFVKPTATSFKWTVENTFPTDSRVVGFVEDVINVNFGSESKKLARVRILKA